VAQSTINSENTQLKHGELERSRVTFPVCIVADGIESGANVGSIFRLADALGVRKLFLSGACPVPPSPKIRKTSRASELTVPFEYREHAIDVVHELKADGYTIVSLEVTTRSVDIRTFDRTGLHKLAVVVGSESSGVGQALLDISDHTLHIPMFGQSSAMNLSAACAIGLFELTRDFMP